MKRVIFLLMAGLLVACGGSVGETPAEAVDVQPTAVIEEPVSEESDATAPESAPNNSTPATTVEISTTPEEAGIVRDQDWTIGADEPSVTIIEYGDFQ